MADVLLRERLKLLARTLDAVAQVLGRLEDLTARTEAKPASAPAATMAAIDKADEEFRKLRESAAMATFSEAENRLRYRQAELGVEGFLTTIRESLRAPATVPEPATLTSRIRVAQAVSNLGEVVADRSGELATLRKKVEAPRGLSGKARDEAWARCLELEFECGRIFADYLDLLSGFAVRTVGFDDGLCRIADELVSDFDNFGNTRWNSLTVPVRRELREDPVAGFVRIGFPEWSVWTLPLAMVDFASFLIIAHPRTTELREEATEKLAGLLRDGVAIPREALAPFAGRRGMPPDSADPKELRPALGRLASLLVVESLATALMGPAYAWATLLMRVEPFPGQDLVERLRRDVVVATLEALKPPGEMAKLLDLENEWSELLSSAGIGSADDVDQRLAPTVELVTLGAVARLAKFLPAAKDWELIEALAQKLHKELPPGEIVEQISRDHYRPTLRHVLNAGWLARLKWPEDYAYQQTGEGAGDPSPLSQSVRDVCLTVIGQVATVTPTGTSPGANPFLSGGEG